MKMQFYQRILILPVLVLLWNALAPWVASGQENSILANTKKLYIKEAGTAGDDFGYEVAVDGNTLAVGAPSNDDKGNNSGCAYLYSYTESNDIQQTQNKLTESNDPHDYDYLGNSLDISGHTIVIGVSQNDDDINGTNSGAAYVARISYDEGSGTWTIGEQTPLTPSDLFEGDYFGNAVAISGNRVVVANKIEGVYVFDNVGSVWEETKLTPEDSQVDKKFGTAVAIDGDTIAVGAINRKEGDLNTGSVYVFTYDGSNWGQEAELFGEDLGAADKFGYSVAVEGDTLIVGAPYHDDLESNESNSGAAYVFRRNAGTWTPEQRLTASDRSANARFGNSVGLSGNTAVVGASKNDLLDAESNPLKDAGSAYLFRFEADGWKEKERLIAFDADAGDEFGCAVAISGDTVVVGVHRGDILDLDGNVMLDAGSAYVYTLVPENHPPVADAGADREVEESSPVTLDGSGSFDLDYDELKYTWTQIRDIGDLEVTLDDPNKAEPTFTAPDWPGENVTLTFQLVVNDGKADCLEPAVVTITVLRSTTNVTEINSVLGSDHRPWGIDKDIYTFYGTEGKQVTVTLKAKSAGKNNHGDRATLKLKDNIRGVSFYRIDSGRLPNQICETLPATGEYHILVAGQPRFFRGKRFLGEYTITLEGASGSIKKGAGSSAAHNKPGCSDKPHKQHPIWNWILSRFGH